MKPGIARQALKSARMPQPPAAAKPHRPQASRQPRCDCGQRAVTVLVLRVGTSPQYTIHLPLCPACLKLEQELHPSY